jgi:hypothetical protein
VRIRHPLCHRFLARVFTIGLATLLTTTLASRSGAVPYQATLTNGPTASVWPMFHHDVRHTGLSTVSTSGDTGTEKWHYTTGGPVESRR